MSSQSEEKGFVTTSQCYEDDSGDVGPSQGATIHSSQDWQSRGACSGATSNFLDVKEAERLGIPYSKAKGWLKAVNSKPMTINGEASDVKVGLGGWKGTLFLCSSNGGLSNGFGDGVL